MLNPREANATRTWNALHLLRYEGDQDGRRVRLIEVGGPD